MPKPVRPSKPSGGYADQVALEASALILEGIHDEHTPEMQAGLNHEAWLLYLKGGGDPNTWEE